MKFEPWMLGAMEEHGIIDTKEGLINRVAKYISQLPDETIDEETFRKACRACDVDPDSFSKSDIDKLNKKLRDM